MDYFQLVTNPTNIPRVPYLPTEPYDGGDFSSYPSRKGWDKTRLSQGDFSEHPPAATAAFLQNWLHFGAFSKLLGYVKLEDFITAPDEDGMRYVVTPKDFSGGLRLYMQLLSLLRFPEQEISEVERLFKAHMDEVALYVRIIHQVMEAHDARARAHPSPVYEQCPCPLPLEVAISIQLYNSILGSLYESLFPPQRGKHLWDWGSRWYARNKLIAAGWCPCDIARLIAYTDAPGTYYATFLDRRETVWSHERCDDRVCLANQIDEGTYVTKHVHEMCFCPLVGATGGEVEKVLQRGEVPVIEVVINEADEGIEEEQDALELSERAYSDVNVRVHSARRMPYIAISHVWSDGLGNAQGNTLPSCQLLRLATMAQNVYHRGKFSRRSKGQVCLWIDTLCVPREDTMRIKAITLMNDTYAKSLAVLVLDSELLRFRRDEFSRYDGFLAQTFVSGWSRRVWTTPEGALNVRNLWIQLESGPEKLSSTPPKISQPITAVDVPAESDIDKLGITYSQWLITLQQMYLCFGFLQVYSSIYRIPGIILLSELFWPWHPTSNLGHHSPQTYLEPPTSRDQAVVFAFSAALHNLHGRSESKLGDRYICLASTLGLSATIIKQLFAIPTSSAAWEESRTLVLLKGIGLVPADIIFHRGEKVTLPFASAWKWAPKDLFSISGRLGKSRGIGKIDLTSTNRGIFVKFEGWIFPQSTPGLDVVNGGFYFPHPNTAGHGGGAGMGKLVKATCYPYPPTQEELDALLPPGEETHRFALLYHGENAALVSVFGKIPWEGWPLWIQETSTRCITARYVCAVGLEEVLDIDDEDLGWGRVEYEDGTGILRRGRAGGDMVGQWPAAGQQKWWIC